MNCSLCACKSDDFGDLEHNDTDCNSKCIDKYSMQKRSSACLIRMPSDLCISFYCLFLMSTQTPNYLLIPKLQWVMMEALHLLFVFLHLSQCSAGSYFNLKYGLVLFGMHATSLPWVPLPKPCCYQLCCMSDSLRRWRDAENYNSHSHSSLLRHKALQRLNFNFSLPFRGFVEQNQELVS